MTLSDYWEIYIPQFVPLKGLHSYICILRIGVIFFLFNGSLHGEKIKMSVTSAYIECTTRKQYHLIELAESFLLKYWIYLIFGLAKTTASML